jgi:CheY-like chemotaxis protein
MALVGPERIILVGDEVAEKLATKIGVGFIHARDLAKQAVAGCRPEDLAKLAAAPKQQNESSTNEKEQSRPLDPRELQKRAERLKAEGKMIPLPDLLKAVREVDEELKNQQDAELTPLPLNPESTKPSTGSQESPEIQDLRQKASRLLDSLERSQQKPKNSRADSVKQMACQAVQFPKDASKSNEAADVGPKILIAHHDAAIAECLDIFLRHYGYQTRIEQSSSGAIQNAGGFGPQLLVIDPIMPGPSGVEAAMRISLETKSKVLFLTTLPSDNDFREMLQGLRRQGCDCEALPLPFEKEQLFEHVHRRIGSAAVITHAADSSQTKRNVSQDPAHASGELHPTVETNGGLSRITCDVGPRVLDFIFEQMRIDGEWSLRDDRKLTWWGHKFAQRIWAEPVWVDHDHDIVRVHAQTDVI